ncbi:hypothetical protein [Methylophilus sp. QUAN]|uniref:hypothetical protein n=1 Tax=Methylophilus sp. QUAN TaxID=2781020 RepID=UPI00188DFBBD|nr:hypothetical protein [Methylophilus sp. QUAN]MBF4990657.1 hypothetical protein [Methylophilus sp. QUAN]
MSRKLERLEHANKLIQIIGSHGRCFFYSQSKQRFARLELRNGRVYFIDDYTEKAIYTHNTGFGCGRWSGFSHGGTLKGLVEWLRDYVTKGQLLPRAVIGLPNLNFKTWKDNIWGYSEEAIITVRNEAFELPMFLEEAKS